MSVDLSLYDLANQVLDWGYDCSKQEWGEELLRLVEAQDSDLITEEVRAKQIAGLGTYVSGIKATRERNAQAKRLILRGIDYRGRPMTPTISVRDDDGVSQGVLWIDATPQQFMEAVLREQAVVDGRNASNAIRLQVVKLLQADESLRQLPTLKDVCEELRVDPDTLGLEGLESV